MPRVDRGDGRWPCRFTPNAAVQHFWGAEVPCTLLCRTGQAGWLATCASNSSLTRSGTWSAGEVAVCAVLGQRCVHRVLVASTARPKCQYWPHRSLGSQAFFGHLYVLGEPIC